MRLRILALVFVPLLAASTPDLSGKWQVKYIGPRGSGLKTVGSIGLDMHVDSDVVTGMVHIGSWPGDAPIADGKAAGNHISFNATGHLNSSSGIPTCHFEIDVDGGQMAVKMTMVRSQPASVPFWEFAGGRQEQ